LFLGSCSAPSPGSAISDGSFEDNYVGWMINVVPFFVTPFGSGFFFISNATTYTAGTTYQLEDYFTQQTIPFFPFVNFAVQPTAGVSAAFFGIFNAPATDTMFQQVTVPDGSNLLTWDMAYYNLGPLGWVPGAQDISVTINTVPANPANALSLSFAATNPIPALQQPSMVTYQVDLTAYQQQQVNISFQVIGFYAPCFAIIDNVRLETNHQETVCRDGKTLTIDFHAYHPSATETLGPCPVQQSIDNSPKQEVCVGSFPTKMSVKTANVAALQAAGLIGNCGQQA